MYPRTCTTLNMKSILMLACLLGAIFFQGCKAPYASNDKGSLAQALSIGKAATMPGFILEQDIFVSGTEGYDTYRIPSLITTQQGTLLAFCEGRTAGAADAGDMDLLLRRSTDGGRTWSAAQVIWDEEANFCGNPCAVVDESTGTIWLLMIWKNGKDEEWMINLGIGRDTSRVFITSSTDDGVTWAAPQEITAMAKDPAWRWYATGPGVGIQLKYGDHIGRLVIPCNHSTALLTLRSHAIYSDDHGETWTYSQEIPGGCNEAQVVELSSGTLMMNMRMQRWGFGYRGVSFSQDGGETWSCRRLDTHLPDPKCQASILRYSIASDSDQNRMLFSNPATGGRTGMTVRLSYDDGASWPVSKLIYPGSSAYSCLTVLEDRTIGLLYEKDDSSRIAFALFDLAFLTEGNE